jgi:glutathionyl-hydroquinone reductase
MVEQEMRPLQTNDVNLLPGELLEDIDATSQWIYDDINNGVYAVGFAGSQQAYEEALDALFEALDRVELRLEQHRYVCGDRFTEADLRLFPTLIRFDAVYYSHFKCSLRRIADYPNLGNYLRDIYQMPGVAETVHIDYYKLGYMGRSERLNPSQIIPKGPDLALGAPHDRERLMPLKLASW